ncbi:iron-containing alcohol dehydrogenase [bacterium]
MSDYRKRAEELLKDWKGDTYTYGIDVLDAVGKYASKFGKKALVFAGDPGADIAWMEPLITKVKESLEAAGVEMIAHEPGARPNAPREDVYRMSLAVAKLKPDCLVPIGGGSTIDAAKAASVLYSLESNDIEPYFGVDQVKAAVEEKGAKLLPVVAVETAASSGAHLTKYSNITDPATGIKKLIVDDTIIPPASVFDYSVTMGAPVSLVLDGGLDGIAHCWEVFIGATGKVYYDKMKEINEVATALIVEALPVVLKDPENEDARMALGLGTDLGGYAIMIEGKNSETGQVEKGGTNGGHLGSFQLIHYLAHGRACAVLNPYYTVLFADAIEDQNRSVAPIFQDAGFIPKDADLASLDGRELAETLAKGMIEFSKSIGFPVTLKEAGVPEDQINVMVEASKNPQLKMKLQNMPTPLDVEKGEIDSKMAPTLKAAFSGDLSLIP